MHQLDADRDRERAADHSADDGEHQVHRADVLVIGRINEAAPTGRRVMLFMRMMLMLRAVSRCGSSHVVLPRIFPLPPAASPLSYSVFEPAVAATLVAGCEPSI